MAVIVADGSVIIATLDGDDALILGSALDLAADSVMTADERWAGVDAGPRVSVIRPD